MPKTISENPPGRQAYVITGPTSGIGRCTAFELAKHGTVILVGRNPGKLSEVQEIIEQKGQRTVSVVRDPKFQGRVVAETRALLAKVPILKGESAAKNQR